jgi:hypothetical protein
MGLIIPIVLKNNQVLLKYEYFIFRGFLKKFRARNSLLRDLFMVCSW